MKVDGVSFEQGDHRRGKLTPTAIVLHRTYGSWVGDYAVGRHGRDVNGDGKVDPIGFHFLIGKHEGNVVQFYATSTVCNHAKGASTWAVGIEFEGRNEDRLTDAQVAAGARIIRAVCDEHEIPLTYAFGGPRRKFNGCLPHAVVPGSDHTDRVTHEDWLRMFPATPPPFIPPPPSIVLEDDMAAEYFSVVDVTDPAAWPPSGAVLRITDTTYIHLSPDEWAAELRVARIAQKPLRAQRMGQADARDICWSRIDVRALNAAAHRA